MHLVIILALILAGIPPRPPLLPDISAAAIKSATGVRVSWSLPVDAYQTCINMEPFNGDQAWFLDCVQGTEWRQSPGGIDLAHRITEGRILRLVAYDEESVPVALGRVTVRQFRPRIYLPLLGTQNPPTAIGGL